MNHPDLELDPEEEANHYAAEGLVAQGRDAARAGEVITATVLFRRALELDPGLEFEPESEARKLAAPSLLKRGLEFAKAGDIEAALAAYAQAQEFDPDIAVAADDWHSLCRAGSLNGYAAEVLFACEQAVELKLGTGDYRESRGLARALTGDVPGAIEDFQAAIRIWREKGACEELRPCEQREAWIAALEAGENPFTPEVLAALRDE